MRSSHHRTTHPLPLPPTLCTLTRFPTQTDPVRAPILGNPPNIRRIRR
jgi:hypothetical protein